MNSLCSCVLLCFSDLNITTRGKVGIGISDPVKRGFSKELESNSESKGIKEVAVGAGAKIRQDLSPDPYPLESWKSVPDAVMTIYFVFQEEFEQIKAGGIRDLNGEKECFLAGIPVG